MTVKEVYKNLELLIANGHGDLELIYEDVRFGDSGSVYIYNEIDEVNEWHVAGILCDMEMNEKYIPVYCDH
jgi:hypothetical protein